MANQTNNRQAGADWYSIVQDMESAAIIGWRYRLMASTFSIR